MLFGSYSSEKGNTYGSWELDGGGHHDLSGRDLYAIEGNGKKTGRHIAEMCEWRFDYSVMMNERANCCECEELSRKYRGMYEDVGKPGVAIRLLSDKVWGPFAFFFHSRRKLQPFAKTL